MNVLLISAASRVGIAPAEAFGDSCAMLLFVSGAISLLIAAYLLYKAPRAHAVRFDRRH